jgi:Fragile site-associated protein C-terminus
VICSFITEFEDHIFVTVDAEAFFFLHDLITSYLKEKDRVVCFLLTFAVMLDIHAFLIPSGYLNSNNSTSAQP